MAEKEYFVHPPAMMVEGCSIGQGTKIWHFSHIMSGCTIGERCNIGQNVVISPGVKLGDGCKIQNNVSVYTGVECEDGVFLGPSCVFTNVINPGPLLSARANTAGPSSKKGPASEPMPQLSAGMISGNTRLWARGLWLPKMFRIMPWRMERRPGSMAMYANAGGTALCGRYGRLRSVRKAVPQK